MRGETDAALPKDAGISAVELLVGLVVVSLVVVVITAGIRPNFSNGPTPREQLLAFIDEARMDVMRTGSTDVLFLTATEARVGSESVLWPSSDLALQVDGVGQTGETRVLLFADGTVSAPAITVLTEGHAEAIRWVERLAP
jgi:hypothetical protein